MENPQNTEREMFAFERMEDGIAMSPTYKTNERLLQVYLTLGQYPVLQTRIRSLMREELFKRDIIDPQEFETRVRENAVQSQLREGLHEPIMEEPEELWEQRLTNVRDQLTEVMFSLQLPYTVFEELVNKALNERGVDAEDLTLSLNPELASRDLVFEQARKIEAMPRKERSQYEPRLQESKVVLIRSMISDQLPYINIAKDWFTVNDLENIRKNKIGAGRIGGKAGGMLMAYRILSQIANDELKACLCIPESYYIGATEFYPFMTINNLTHWLDQKYKTEDEMRKDYPKIVKDFEQGEFPLDVQEKLLKLLRNVGNKPLIVRSSSLLEDNFGTAFAGKYESVFLPNQGTPAENLEALTRGAGHVYASGLNPNALLYRRQRGLADYDERMALLIQVVQGNKFGKYYMPHASGVAFSRNSYRWTPQIRMEDGFVRLVWGMGTRAVDRVGNDFPRLIALSHPLLRPSSDPVSIRRYSQHYVDLIDLEENVFKTLPIHEVLGNRYAPLRYIAQYDEGGFLSTLRSNLIGDDPEKLVITFDELLRRTHFAECMREVLQILESTYAGPVDMEFTLEIRHLPSGQPELHLTILQCRPQSHLVEMERASIPTNLKKENIIFSTRFVVPQGHIDRVDYVLYVPPSAYFSLPTVGKRNELARAVGRVNSALCGENFICVGPGRWGSSNPELGVSVDYGDIYNARSLVEMAGEGIVPQLEPSLGTHFFQDLMEAQIFPLGIIMDDVDTIFNKRFFKEMPNHLLDWVNVDDDLAKSLHLIRVSDYKKKHHIRVVMDSEKTHAVAFLEKN